MDCAETPASVPPAHCTLKPCPAAGRAEGRAAAGTGRMKPLSATRQMQFIYTYLGGAGRLEFSEISYGLTPAYGFFISAPAIRSMKVTMAEWRSEEHTSELQSLRHL